MDANNGFLRRLAILKEQIDYDENYISGAYFKNLGSVEQAIMIGKHEDDLKQYDRLLTIKERMKVMKSRRF